MVTYFILVINGTLYSELVTVVCIMVEVAGLIVQRSVFLAGETVYCEIKFINKGDGPCTCQPKNGLVNGSHKMASNCCKHSSRHLAWASVQIHCQCNVNESRIRVPCSKLEQETLASSKNTSFMPMKGEKGYCYVSTKPKILFCNLELQFGQFKTFLYCDKIPANAPPSYPGQLVKFSYKVTIGIGRLHAPTCLLKLPIRVLDCEEAVSKLASSSSELSGSNPFLEEEPSANNSLLDVFSDYLSSSTSRRNNNTYNIWSTHGSVGKFCLPKLNYRIGEDIVGTFDFTLSAVKCIKYSASLKLEETIDHSFLKEREIGRNKPTVSIHGRVQECCCNSRVSYFTLHVPLTVTPGFVSDIVAVRWKLHFEFTTLRLANSDERYTDVANDDGRTAWVIESEQSQVDVPDNVGVETMTWDLPLNIFSTNPDQVALSAPWTAKSEILLT